MAFPGVAWFSYMQLFFLWLACTVSSRSILRSFTNAGHSPVVGGVTSAAYLLAFGMTYSCVITYTVTAAMLAAAAVLQILSVDCERSTDAQIIRGMLAKPCAGCACLQPTPDHSHPDAVVLCRRVTLPRGSPTLGLARGFVRAWRPLVITAIVFTVTLGALAGLREIEINAKGMGDYLRWQRASP